MAAAAPSILARNTSTGPFTQTCAEVIPLKKLLLGNDVPKYIHDSPAVNTHTVGARCVAWDGRFSYSIIDLNLCVANKGGRMQGVENGNFAATCKDFQVANNADDYGIYGNCEVSGHPGTYQQTSVALSTSPSSPPSFFNPIIPPSP
ncbi:hypothetical protein F4808DRAFT_468447 [Astrocystis sublimbata]|nr:hypothetical protein F4808DRAFT_468447 [Astrocystis sublimbata]